MPLLARWTLGFLLSGTLVAQSLPEALAMVPEDTSVVLIFKEAGATDAKFKTFSKRFGKESSFHEFATHFGTGVEGFKGGPLLFLERDAPKGKASVEVLLAPMGNYKQLVKSLKAKPAGRLQTFKRQDQVYFLASRGSYALLSKDRAFLQEVLQTQAGLASSLKAQLPWIQAQDIVGVIPERAFHKGLAKAKAELEKPAKAEVPGGTSPKAAKEMIGRAMAALDQSSSCFAFCLNLPEDRSLRASARIFLRPGSSVATWALPDAAHPLLGVPTATYAMAFGGPNPKGLSTWASEVFTPLLFGDQSPEDLKALQSLQAEVQGNIRSATWVLGTPLAPNKGLLSGTSGIVKVEDPAKYLDALERLTRMQGDLATKKVSGDSAVPKPSPTFARNVLPSTPSATITTPLGGGEAAPQSSMFLSLLFGGDSLRTSVAQADDHTLVLVLGGAEPLQKALEAYRTAKATLDQEAGTKAVDALLPSHAPWRLYLHPGGLRDLAQSVLETIPLIPGGKPLPKVDPAPPIAMGFRVDAEVAELTLATTGDTLDAIAKWGRAMDALISSKKGHDVVPETAP